MNSQSAKPQDSSMSAKSLLATTENCLLISNLEIYRQPIRLTRAPVGLFPLHRFRWQIRSSSHFSSRKSKSERYRAYPAVAIREARFLKASSLTGFTPLADIQRL